MWVEVIDPIYFHGGSGRELSRVLDVDIVQAPTEGILVRSSWIVGDFDSRSVLRDIVIDVQVGTLLKSVMDGLGARWRKIIMNVCKAMEHSQS